MKNVNNIKAKTFLSALCTIAIFGTLTSMPAEAKDGIRKKIEVTYIKKSNVLLLFKTENSSTYKRSKNMNGKVTKMMEIKTADTLLYENVHGRL